MAYRFSEAYSGLSLERPELDKLRELVRNEQYRRYRCYSLDRLSRDPGHGVIITQELEKHGVKLETVTEDVDNSELGKLISYIRGYASKVEAEKIRERTMRGKRARAKKGGYQAGVAWVFMAMTISKWHRKTAGRRVINETEATWVRQMYQWLVNEGYPVMGLLTALELRTRLPSLVKSGIGVVQSILKNPAYTGKTYAFTT